MWLYQVLDITATLTESLGLYLFSICFCKEPRYRASVNRWLITGISFLCAYTLTWFSELGALKAPFLLTIYLVLLKVCYRDSIYQCAVAEELNYIATTMLSESIGMLIAHWIYQDQMFVLVDGISLLRWEIYVITLSIRIVSFFVIYIICRKFRYRISPKDFLPLTGIFVVAFLPFVFNAFQHLNMNKAGDSVLYVFITVMPFIFITIFLYVKNIIYLREQEQQDKIQIAQLQQQYAYYQDIERLSTRQLGWHECGFSTNHDRAIRSRNPCCCCYGICSQHYYCTCWCPKLYKQYGNSHYHKKTRICNDSKYRNDKTTTTENAHV